MIYDCFSVFNELDLLELRLRYLDDVVDRFVITEANRTHSGKEKPFHLLENWDRFKPWHDKVHRIEVDLPVFDHRLGADKHQRSQIIRGLTDVKPDDYIMISDLDEFPMKKFVRAQEDSATTVYDFYFRMNTQYIRGPFLIPFCDGTFGLKGKTFADKFNRDVQAVRDAYSHFQPRMNPGGWHFGWQLGGDDSRIRTKLNAFAHGELDNEDFAKRMQQWKDEATNGDDWNETEVAIWKPDDPRYEELSAYFTPVFIEKFFAKVP